MKKMTINISYCNECEHLLPKGSIPFYSLEDGKPHCFCSHKDTFGKILPSRYEKLYIEIPDWCPLEDIEQ